METGTETGAFQKRRRGKHSVTIGRTPVGWGIFAQRKYRVDEIIGEIQGAVVDDVSYGSDYCFRLGDRHRLEPASPFRYVNHSCDPNSEFDFFDLSENGDPSTRRRAFLIALRDIRCGEQVTIDYNWSATAAIPCRCQSPHCRGWIVDEDQLGELLECVAQAKQTCVLDG
ncbi:MAG: SET domain-containing protein [Pirellulaceae bacterium]